MEKNDMRLMMSDMLSTFDERMKGHFAKNEALFDLINFKLDTINEERKKDIEEIKNKPIVHICNKVDDINEIKKNVDKSKTRERVLYGVIIVVSLFVGILKTIEFL